jgi:chromosome segregation ATPase
MTNRTANRLDRIGRLAAARAKDSEAKRSRTLATTSDLLSAGIRITVARVAREARVSTWLVYNVPELRDAVDAAIAAQERDGIAPIPRASQSNQSAESLRTDLALARDEIGSLRTEVAKLRSRLQLELGAEAERATASELVQRLQEVENANQALSTALMERDNRISSLVEERETLEAELEGKTEALRRLMFTTNTES